MKSDDDPEARIRELEQPLADAARSSETAANPSPGKWAPPSGPPAPPLSAPPFSPLPPLPYNDSFSRPPRRSQARFLWIAIAVFVIGMIALPIGIFLFSAHQVSRSGLPTMFPIPGSPSPNPIPSVAMPSTSATTAGDNITVSGISEVRAITCNGGTVDISGITNNIVITGHCASVTVSGIQNQITVDAADAIQASGSQNQVTYHAGSPTIGNSGIANVVKKG
jgi:hypothetical protein